jgi:hypothetical protein
MTFLIVGGFVLVVTVVPGVAAFLRPSWAGRIVVVGVVLSFAEWMTAWTGDTGDIGRTGALFLAGIWGFVTLVLWVVGAAIGRALGRRRNRRRPDAQPAASALSSPR